MDRDVHAGGDDDHPAHLRGDASRIERDRGRSAGRDSLADVSPRARCHTRGGRGEVNVRSGLGLDVEEQRANCGWSVIHQSDRAWRVLLWLVGVEADRVRVLLDRAAAVAEAMTAARAVNFILSKQKRSRISHGKGAEQGSPLAFRWRKVVRRCTVRQ